MQVSELTPNPYDANCPTRTVLDRIGDRWTTLVVLLLAERPRRFSELGRLIAGISQKMLTQTLRGLERDGLATRTVHAEVPPRVVYELTDLGRSLIEPLSALDAWAREHIAAVEVATYDAEKAAG
jgi:DNA-binding HxlR family transcriptional regulator